MIEEKIENQPLNTEENKPKTEPSLIEIDGTVEAADKHKPLSAADKRNKLKDMKAKKEAEYKAKQKEEKQKLKEQRKLERAASGKGGKLSKGVIISIVVFVLLNGIFAFLYFKKPDFFKKLIPGKHAKEQTLVNSDSTIAAEDTLSLADEEQNSEIKETAVIENPASSTTQAEPEVAKSPEPVVVEKTSKSKVEVQPNVKKSARKTEATKTTASVPAGPCWIVSFSSVKDEKVASKGVKQLVDKGFLGGYYWMPDFESNAKQLYKVYSGPYTSEQEARAKQREIVVFNEDAYVMKLNK